jgi:hypothetical protein
VNGNGTIREKKGRNMTKKHKSHIPMCDPSECDNCIYIGEGTFICDKHDNAIVIDEWSPTDNFSRCLAKQRGYDG